MIERGRCGQGARQSRRDHTVGCPSPACLIRLARVRLVMIGRPRAVPCRELNLISGHQSVGAVDFCGDGLLLIQGGNQGRKSKARLISAKKERCTRRRLNQTFWWWSQARLPRKGSTVAPSGSRAERSKSLVSGSSSGFSLECKGGPCMIQLFSFGGPFSWKQHGPISPLERASIAIRAPYFQAQGPSGLVPGGFWAGAHHNLTSSIKPRAWHPWTDHRRPVCPRVSRARHHREAKPARRHPHRHHPRRHSHGIVVFLRGRERLSSSIITRSSLGVCWASRVGRPGYARDQAGNVPIFAHEGRPELRRDVRVQQHHRHRGTVSHQEQ